MATSLLLVIFGAFYHRRIEKGEKPKFRAVNFILFANLDLKKKKRWGKVGTEWKLWNEIKFAVCIGFYDS